MPDVKTRLDRALESVRKITDFQPQLALVLGSGLGAFADSIRTGCVIDYAQIEGFPVSTVEGHRGRFVFGWVENGTVEIPVVIMQGRVHYYEGYSMEEVVLPIRLAGLLGARVLFLTNASGGIREDFGAGDFMLITDQISSFVPSPLNGPNEEEFGPRFPDMSRIYREDLQNAIRSAAKQEGIALKEGVYIQFSGPNYESLAEIRMARTLGADAVGMSTACEAIAANHMGMRVCGISCISNPAAGLSSVPLSHEEVQAQTDRAAADFERLIRTSVLNMKPLL